MIDSRAEIHPSAKIADNVEIGPWTIIGPNVEIDSGSKIHSHVVIQGPTRIGKNNTIFQFSSIGEAPQDKKYDGEDTVLEIGDGNTIREFVTLNRGTIQGGGITRIGNNNLFMAYTHVAHDCIIGNECILVNNASLAGHVTVQDYAILGAFSGFHQYVTIGAHSFVAKSTYITKDVLPYVMVEGYDPRPRGINSVGLKRRGFTDEQVLNIKRAYKLIFRQGKTTTELLPELEAMMANAPELEGLFAMFKDTERGILR